MNIAMKIIFDDQLEEAKLKEFLKKVDGNFYHRIIENRQSSTCKYFPHRGENGNLFMDTFQYVKLTTKNKDV